MGEVVLQSSVIPFCRRDNDLLVMLVTSRADGRWILPKGHLEPDMTPGESAAKEALEEAGVTGRLYPDAVHTYSFTRLGLTIRVEVYLLEIETVLDTWDEMEERERAFLPLDQAIEQVHYPDLKNLLAALPGHLERIPGRP